MVRDGGGGETDGNYVKNQKPEKVLITLLTSMVKVLQIAT